LVFLSPTFEERRENGLLHPINPAASHNVFVVIFGAKHYRSGHFSSRVGEMNAKKNIITEAAAKEAEQLIRCEFLHELLHRT
jgi:hypothetical protein